MLDLPKPGTHGFFPALLNHLSGNNPIDSTSPDATIIHALLLCLITSTQEGQLTPSQSKHLILRTSQAEDVGTVVKLVHSILTTQFAYSAQKLKLRPPILPRSTNTKRPNVHRHSSSNTTPTANSHFHTSRAESYDTDEDDATTNVNAFLRSLFLPPNFTQDPFQRTEDEYEDMDDRNAGSSRRRRRKMPSRSRSRSKSKSRYPDSADGTFTLNSTEGHEWMRLPSVSTLATGSKPIIEVEEGGRVKANQHRRASGCDKKRRLSTGTVLPTLPRALVVSGLEYASVCVQREFNRVLVDGSVVIEGSRCCGHHEPDEGSQDDLDGVWNLPDGFIVVYVCPWDPRERPKIHKTLLDKFSISATISLTNATRHAYRSLSLHSYSHSHQSRSFSTPLPLQFPPSKNSYSSSIPDSYFTYPVPEPETAARASQSFDTKFPVHSPDVQPVPIPTPQPAQLQPDPPLLETLLPVLRTYYSRTIIPSPISLYLSDLFSAARHHPQLDGTLLTVKAMKDVEDLARAQRVLDGDVTGSEVLSIARDGRSATQEQDSDLTSSYTDDGTGNGGVGWEDLGNDVNSISDIRGIGNINMIGTGAMKIELSPPSFDIDPRAPLTSSTSSEESLRAQSSISISYLDVSEADIARIAPRVMSHRLRVRDGPEDEILGSALFGAVKSGKPTARYGGMRGGERVGDLDEGDLDELACRSTVKDILVGILMDV